MPPNSYEVVNDGNAPQVLLCLYIQVLFYNSHKYPSVTFASATHMKKNYINMKLLLEKLNIHSTQGAKIYLLNKFCNAIFP